MHNIKTRDIKQNRKLGLFLLYVDSPLQMQRMHTRRTQIYLFTYFIVSGFIIYSKKT